MPRETPKQDNTASHLDEHAMTQALTALGRAINIVATYGTGHPAIHQAIDSAHTSLLNLLQDRNKISLGTIKGTITVDGRPIQGSGVLLRSLEQRLAKLEITGLRITRDITPQELGRLVELLSQSSAEKFTDHIETADLSHITTERTRYEEVHENETVVDLNTLPPQNSMEPGGVLVLDDISAPSNSTGGEGGGSGDSSVHVNQIVAFLKGDIDDAQDGVSEELAELASDPSRLGQLIMESVAIRQKAETLSGESLSDVVLGCLRKTFSNLRKQPTFQSKEGVADLQKSLLLLEETLLDKLRDLAGEENPVLDRQIVQAVREMNESLDFERTAYEYMEHQQAIETNKEQLREFLKNRGPAEAQDLLDETGFPRADWRKIMISKERDKLASATLPSGLNTLTSVFERLESLIKTHQTGDREVKDLLGEANANIDGTLDATREKLDHLSRKLEDTGTIGGEALSMSRKELLSSISEVAQELMQPLTAINASMEMMLSGYVGKVTTEQHDMLTLARHSGEHLKYLMNELISIVGCPTNTGIDRRFHTTSEEVVLLQENPED